MWEDEHTANCRIDELEHHFSSLKTATCRMYQLEARVKAIKAKLGMAQTSLVVLDMWCNNIEEQCQDLDDSRDQMDA